MYKYIIFTIGILSIGIIVISFGLSKYSFSDIQQYLVERGRFNPFPEEIRQKHAVTIEKVDKFIRKENRDSVTSRSEKFNLKNYLGIIEIGVFPYLDKNDPLRNDVQSLIQDIRNYLKR